MSKDCCFCDGSWEPQPNITLEEIREDIAYLRHPDTVKMMEEWAASRPPEVQKLLKEFPNDQLYRVKDGAPYKHTCTNCIVAMHSIAETNNGLELRLRVLQSPIGTAGIVATIDPEWLEPVELEDLESIQWNQN